MLERVQLELRLGHMYTKNCQLQGDNESSGGVVERSKCKRLRSVKTILTGVAEVLYTPVMYDGAVESDGNWSTEVHGGIGKATGSDTCAFRNAMVQDVKLVESRQGNPSAPRHHLRLFLITYSSWSSGLWHHLVSRRYNSFF